MQITIQTLGIIIALVGNAIVIAFYGGRITGRLDELCRNSEKAAVTQKEHGDKLESHSEQIAVINTRCGIKHSKKGDK